MGHVHIPNTLPTSLLSKAGFPYNFIEISTPAGTLSRVSESIVFEVGSSMSISRLCVRSSKCSREFLSMCGPRMTQKRLIAVGSGTGPETRAPVRSAASTICPADWSSSLWSKAFSMMRIFWLLAVTITRFYQLLLSIMFVCLSYTGCACDYLASKPSGAGS